MAFPGWDFQDNRQVSGWNSQDGIFRIEFPGWQADLGWNFQDGSQISGWDFQDTILRITGRLRMESVLLRTPLRPGRALTIPYMELCACITSENSQSNPHTIKFLKPGGLTGLDRD